VAATAYSVEIDPRQLAALRRKLGPDLYRKAFGTALSRIAFAVEGVAKSRTPVVTGNLRRSIQSDVRRVEDERPEARVESRALYANWIETGKYETRPGVEMKTMPGGYRMFEQAADEAKRIANDVLARAARDVQTTWAA
jgi:hypothetical protein